MKIVVTSVLVGDQKTAPTFHAGVPGVVKKTDVPSGGRRFPLSWAA